MTLDKFKLWSVNALKVYLSRRNKSVNGNFDELSARAFCAWEENIPIDENAEQREQRLLHEYKAKLKVGTDIFPDPFSLTTGWKGEQTGMEHWPSVYVTDIATYLNCNTPGEIVNRVLNEYKEGKAYRYFDCGWVKEVFFHDIRSNSDKCILKAKVTPSQSVNNKNYDVWVLVMKKGDNSLGGEILAGYCSCTAGMLGTCNHIAGVLFRVERAIKTGLTKQSCTDKPCQWNEPKNKTTIKPVRADSVQWKKSHYLHSKESSTAEGLARSNFTPLSKAQLDEVKNQEHMRLRLYDIVKDEVPNSVFVLLKEKRRLTNKSVSINVPPPLIRVSETLRNKDISQHDKEEILLKSLNMTTPELQAISRETITQSSSLNWRQHRKGRITASNFHRISSRVNTLRKDPLADPAALVNTIIGSKEVKQTLAMKHGLSMEPFAKKTYTSFTKKRHKKFKASDSGLSILDTTQYIAASADLEIECECCGKGLCEIKCPESIKECVPSTENLPYLNKNGNDYSIEKTHSYYFQIQGQMGVLERNFCDLFVYTAHGNVTVRVQFDKGFWEELLEKLMWFWQTHVLKELVNNENNKENQFKSPTLKLNSPEDSINKTPITDNCPPASTCDLLSQCQKFPTVKSSNENVLKTQLSNQYPEVTTRELSEAKIVCKARRSLNPVSPNDHKNQNVRKVRKHKNNTRQPVYLYGVCGLDCVDNPLNDSEQSVSCDLCCIWVHYICAGVDDSVCDSDEWLCSRCR